MFALGGVAIFEAEPGVERRKWRASDGRNASSVLAGGDCPNGDLVVMLSARFQSMAWARSVYPRRTQCVDRNWRWGNAMCRSAKLPTLAITQHSDNHSSGLRQFTPTVARAGRFELAA